MKTVLEHIEQSGQAFSQHPFLSFVQDSNIDIQKRFCFAPCLAPLVMGFSDLNKLILRDTYSVHPYQRIINIHSEEDDDHWEMYLHDLEVLGLSKSLDLVGALRQLWADDHERTRRLVYGLTALSYDQGPQLRLAVVEAIESTGDTAWVTFCKAADDFANETGKVLQYFGHKHAARESGHAMGTGDIEHKLESIVFTPEKRSEAIELVDQVFSLFSGMFDELLDYAQNN